MEFTLPFQSFSFSSTDAGGEFHAFTEWRAVDPSETRATGFGEVQGIWGTGANVSFCIQTATDVLNPDAHTSVMTGVTTNGVKNPDGTATTISLVGKKYIRAGCSGKVTSGVGFVRMGGRIRTWKN